MKKHLHKLILFSATACLSACTAQEPLTDYVDPRIGTAHSRWFFFTPAAVPFGMAKLAPTTDGHLGNPNGWEAVGYDSRHTSIEGFANFHEFQVGGVVVAPTVGELQTVPGPLDNPDAGYRSRFDKKDEVARPGYYSVLLKDYGVKAELTATERVGFHRYTFPATEEANLIFNIGTRMGESGPVRDASVTYTDDGRIEGWVVTEPAYVDIYQKGATVTMYFSAVLDAEPAAWGAFSGEQTFAGERSRTGAGAGLYLRFDTRERQQVGLKIGLSYTSVENARLNLEKEAARKDFDRVRREANDTWEEALGRLRVEGGLHDDRVKFYTGLFHALLGRGLANDVNGAYPANDGTVGQIALDGAGRPVHDYYNTDAIWGAYWNLTQLWSIAYPEYYADWVASQLLVYKDAGWLGDGIACSKYVSGVGTNFTGLAIAAAYNCGIRNFDVALGYQAARKNELGSEGRPAGAGKLDVGKFVSQGYSPYLPELGMQTTPDGSGFAASHTLEYSFSAYAVAQMARQLGHEADYEQLKKLSGGWELLFDPETKYIRPRDGSGEFIADFDPYAAWAGFQEGNAVQYTYYVPHDIDRLVEMVGREEFNNRLDSTFLISRESVFGGGKTINAFAGVHAYYNHGNQPNLHISALFNFSGKPVALAEMDAHDLQRILRHGGDPRLRLRAGRRPGTAGGMVRHGLDGALRREGAHRPRPDVPDRQPPVRQGDDPPQPRLLHGQGVRDRNDGQHAGELLYRFAGTGRQTLAERTASLRRSGRRRHAAGEPRRGAQHPAEQITTKNIPSWHNRHIIATPWAWTSAAAMSARRW